MQRARLFPFIVILVAALSACGRDTPRLTLLTSEAVVLAFGDSLTYGTGAAKGESYPAQLERLIGRKVVESGVPGEISAEGAARLAQLLDEHEPALLLLCHGGNDLLRRLDPQETVRNLRAMIRMARERGIAVVLIAVPQPGIWLSGAPFYRELADELRVPLEEALLADILADRELKSDTVHPNAAGYRRLAEGVAALLREAGAVK